MSFNIRTLLLSVIFVLVGFCVYGQDTPSQVLPEPVFSERPATSPSAYRPFNYNVPTFDHNQNKINMDQYKDKILVVHCFSTEDRTESETMLILWQRFYEKYRGRKDIRIIFISYGDRDETVEFTGSLGITYPVFFRSLRDDGSSPAYFPTTQIVDRRGAILFSHTGYADWMTPKTEIFLRRISVHGS